MCKTRKVILILCIVFFTTVLNATLGAVKYTSASGNGEVTVTSSRDRLNPGEIFDIEFRVRNITDIHGASIDLSLDSSLIEIIDVVPGTIYDGLTEGSNYRYFRWMDNAPKGNTSAAVLLTGVDNGISREGSLFILKARAVKAGILSMKPGKDYTIKLSNSSKTKNNKIENFTSRDASFTIVDRQENVVKEKLEDTSPRIKYTGTWYNHWEPRNSGGLAKFTNFKPASFEFSFEGTGFRWYGLANKFKGKAKITINGVTEIYDTFSSGEQYQKMFYEKTGLPNGRHNVKIEVHTDHLNVDYIEILETRGGQSVPVSTPTPSAGTTPVPSQPAVSPTPSPGNGQPTQISTTIRKIEQTDSSIRYNGFWMNHWENRNSGGSARFTNERGAFIEFTFTGTGFRWYGLANKFKGKVRVTINNESFIVDTFSASEQYQKLFYEKTGLPNGTHKVRLETFTDYISVDFIEIIQQTQATVPSSPPASNNLSGGWTRFEENNNLLKYTGSWLRHDEVRNSGGSARFTNSRSASVEFTFTGTGFRWYGLANKHKGPVIVTINGRSERVDTYFSGEQYQKVFYEKRGLAHGTHTVKLTIVYDYISVDCIEIENGRLN